MRFIDDLKIPDHPYPELREVLQIFVNEIAAELKENLVLVFVIPGLASLFLF